MQTDRATTRYKKIRRRLKYMDVYAAQHMHYPTEFEEDDAFSSEDEPLVLSAKPVLPKYRHVVPGDFILIFNIIALASSLEREFPYRAEYWWTLLPGTLDQACMCLSMQRWVDELKTCESEESFLTTYQSFLDTTWEAVENRVPSSDTFPYVKPTPQELSVAYYMKNRALILHNRIVWGPDADKDNPKPPSNNRNLSQNRPRRVLVQVMISSTHQHHQWEEMGMTTILTGRSQMTLPKVKGMSHRILKRKRKRRRLV